MKIEVLDTTLRDGAQAEGVTLSIDDKAECIRLFDDLKIDYIEAGTPFANPKDKKLLCDDTIFTVGDENKKIKKVAMINGAGGDDECFSRAREVGADLYISGEFKHHILLEAKETNYALMSVGHYASEMCFNDVLNEILKCHFDIIKIVKYYEGNPFNG